MGKPEENFHATVEALVMGKPLVDASDIRFKRQRAIEDAIDSFRPDPNEAVEILDALMAALNKRYPDQLSDVEDCAKDLRDALVEADGIAG